MSCSEFADRNHKKMLGCEITITEWKDIPVELLLRILSLVDDDQVIIVATGVCSGWREALSWGLTQLNLSWCKKNINNLVLSLVPKFTKLQVLNLQQATPQLHDDAIAMVSAFCADLQDLNLSKNVKLTDAALYALAHGCPNLSRLNINGCKAMTDQGVAYLASFCKKITFLNLGGCRKAATDTALKAVGLHCNRLQAIDVRWCENVSDIGVKSLANGCPNLRALDLCGCIRITDESVIALANNCPQLRSLGLQYCLNLTDRAMYGLAGSRLRKNHMSTEGLVYLDISLCTALNPLAVQAVCDSFPALHTCPGRLSLIITGCLRLSSAHCACACACPSNMSAGVRSSLPAVLG